MSISDKQKLLIERLADGGFHSGTELADSLEVSRTTIWKLLNNLADLGLQISAIRGKGYRLARPLELLNSSVIQACLSARSTALIASLEIFAEIDSTNRYLNGCAEQHAPSGTICLAEYQSAGKGRRGRNWVSPFADNIYLSILWRFQNGFAHLAGLSLAIGVAVVRALNCYFSLPNRGSTVGFSLKWPNDIYFQGQKFGGILIEISGESEGSCAAVVGLGLNWYLPEQRATGINQAWTDLSKITGLPTLGRNQFIGALLNQLFAVLDGFETTGIKAYLEEWRDLDCLKNQPATLFLGSQTFTGIVQGIDDNGLLLLALGNGKIQAFASGEVTFSEAL